MHIMSEIGFIQTFLYCIIRASPFCLSKAWASIVLAWVNPKHTLTENIATQKESIAYKARILVLTKFSNQ